MKAAFQHPQRAFFCLLASVALAFLTAFGLFSWSVGLNPGNFKASLFLAAMDALVFTAPMALMGRRFRWTLWPVLVAVELALVANLLYFRNFGLLAGGSALFSGDLLNPLIVRSTLALLRPADLLWLLPLALAGAGWALFAGRAGRYVPPVGLRIGAAAVLIILPSVQLVNTVRKYCAWYGISKGEAWAQTRTNIVEAPSMTVLARDMGMDYYFVRALLDLLPSTRALTPDESRCIEDMLDGSGLGTPMIENRGKNLILIVVESLNWPVISRADLDAVAPNLRALAADSTAMTLPMLSMVGPGGSCDGQLMYNTGLMPLTDRAFTTRFAAARYPSLAKALKGYVSEEFIGENYGIWNHNLTGRSFGFRAINHELSKGMVLQDSAIFARTEAILDTLPQPFYAQITTLDMHTPYTAPRAGQSVSLPGFTPRELCYLSDVAAFDRALGRFLDRLKSTGLWSWSVIAIVGDHAAPTGSLGGVLESDSVPLILVNAGTLRKPQWGVGQIDLFPTLLDVMGVESYRPELMEMPYRGLGSSILAPGEPRRPVPHEAELIILGRRFGR